MAEMGIGEYFICGGFGGACLVLVGHPLDTMKVKLQTMPKPKPGEKPMYDGMIDCARKTFQYQGIKGFYKGMSVTLFTISPILSVSFMTFGLGKKIFAPPPGQQMTYLRYFAAGAFSGIFTTSIMAPGERIKCLLQTQKKGQLLYHGPLDCVQKLFKKGGIANIYRGTAATLLRDIPSRGTYFLSYEAAKDIMTKNGKEKPTVIGTIAAGGFAGITHWLVGMPADVLKSRVQTAPDGKYPNGVRDAFAELMKTEGPMGLYKGIAPVVLRAIPANAACFVGFELAKRMLDYLFLK